MSSLSDPVYQQLLGGIFAALALGTLVGQILKRRARTTAGRETVANMNQRINAWWVMCVVFAVAVVTGGIGSIVLFALLSFLALREFITLVDSGRADHRALLIAFFIALPAQYVLVGVGWYGLFSILIPVYAFLLIPAVLAIIGETQDFLQRTATIQWGLAICVYAISHAPALLLLDVPGYSGREALLLLFLVLVVQLSEVLQYVFGKLFGRHRIAPGVSPNKTWEGFVGGVTCATIIGTALYWATPFAPLEAAAMSLLIALAGFLGGLVMAAIKRDRGVKDYGALIPGHGGVLDRIDSLTFAAPVFFHVTRFFFQ
ncbi:MAG: phosphatidate cytidylyltransferase [Solirubrobacteraceae bacterium]